MSHLEAGQVASASSDDNGKEAGFTLVELLVYIMFAVVILTLVGGLLINATRTERDVRSTADASSAGQIIMSSVQTGVRNASQVSLTDVEGGQLLTVRTAGRTTPIEWSCQAWFYSPVNDGTLYMTRTTPAAPIAAPTPENLASWSLLGERVNVTGDTVFTAVAGLVDINLHLDAGTQPVVGLSSKATARNLASTGAPCF